MQNRVCVRATTDQAHEESEFHLLREVMRTYQAILTAFSRGVGMPAARLTLLRLLAVGISSQVAGVLDIARHLGVNAAAITRQLQDMEHKGLVVRRPDARDKRRSLVRLSKKGRQVFARLHARSHELERTLLSAVTAEQVRTAARVLTALRAVLEAGVPA